MSVTIDVFNTGYLPIDGGPGWDPDTAATWPASTATLISGARDAILVDALMTVEEGRRLAAWISETGKNLTSIVVTHGHGDHFFGAGPVLEAFPQARLLALNTTVIEEARYNLGPEVQQNWIAWFGDRFDRRPALPQPVDSDTLTVDGHPVHLVEVGGADGVLNTVVHIPELNTVCSGDAVYNNIHMWLWNSTPDSRRTWLATIDKIADLRPATIIAGHRDPGAPDDDAERQLAQSRSYIEAFDRAVAKLSSAQEVIDEMTGLFPGYGNPYTLFAAAYSQFQN
ncbi:MBL fold metallo-hydrolase [Nocardia sp. NPDC004604]|uniref:MBL fold metallo-hydrolase n=1 Tax=Nocardia sp. NPDC004604 TaxID=3157013 RepID=UPI0033A651AE